MDYKEFFTTNNKSGWKTREDRLKVSHPEIYNEIILYSESHAEFKSLPFKEKVWHFINNSTSLPICICGNKIKFKGNLINGYNLNCSLKCSANNINTKEKNRLTSLVKYGVEHSAKSNTVRNKYKETCVDRYGVDNVSKVVKIRQKVVNTTIKNHGVSSVLSLPLNKEILKKYSIKKYGTNHPSNSNEIKDKKKNTLLKNYGVETPMHSVVIKNKNRNTLLKNYGVLNPMYSEKLKNKCRDNNIQTKFNNFITRFNTEEIDVLKEWTGDTLTFNCRVCDNDYTLSRELFILRNTKNRTTCLNCNPLYKKDSYGENEIESFIKSLLPNDNVEINNRTILNGKELDIYILSKNLAIEFNGLYWHSELFVNRNYHLNKTEECEKQGIQLIHIFEDEWLYKQDIVKSRLRNILGLTQNKISGRKTKIMEVSSKDSRLFLDMNHIQGNVNGSIRLGLYYEDELVSLMAFGKGRVMMGGNSNEFELLRFCNKLDTSVIGGADKLLKHFIKTYNPKKIVSYADRRWSQGNLYEKLGFVKIHSSTPNYYYIINGERKYRFGFRKNILVKQGYNKNKSEHEIMLDRKIYRIYDCGVKRYELNN